MSAADLGFHHRYVEGSDPITLLLLHGTGGDEDDLLPLGRALAPSAHLLSPRGKVLENGVPRFFRRVAMGVFDEEDLRARTYELGSFVDDAVKAYGLDADAMVAVGYSNGANIGASMLLLRPGLVRAAALLHAMAPFEPEGSVDLSTTSVVVTGGRRDPYIPPEGTERLAEILSERGADVRLEMQPGGHELTHAEVELVAGWLEGLDVPRAGA